MPNPSQASIENASQVCASVRDQSSLKSDHSDARTESPRIATTPATSHRVSPHSPQSATSLASRRHESVPAITASETTSQAPLANRDRGSKTAPARTATQPWRTFAHSDSQVSDFRKLHLPVLESEHLSGPQYSKSARDLNASGHAGWPTPLATTSGGTPTSPPSGSPSEKLSQPETCIPPPIFEEESSEDSCTKAPELSVTPGTIDRRHGQTLDTSRNATAPMHLPPIASTGRLFIPLQSSDQHCSSSNGQSQPLGLGPLDKQKNKSESSWTFDSVKLQHRQPTELKGSKQLWESFIGSQLVVAAVELKQTDHRISLWTLKFYSPEVEARFSAFAKRIRTFPLAPFKWTLLIPITSQLIMVDSSLQAYKLILQACPNVQGTCILCQGHVWTLVCIVSALLIAVLLFTSVGKAAAQRTRRQRLSLGFFILFVMVHLSGILCGGLCRLGPYKEDWTLVDGTIQLALTCAGRDPGGQASQGLQWLETSFQTRITSAYSYIYLLLAATQLSFLQVMALGLFLLSFLAICIITVVPSTTSLLWLLLASLVQDVCKAAIASYQRDLLARACYLLVSTYQSDSDREKNKLVIPPILQQPLPQAVSASRRKHVETDIPSDTCTTRTTEPPRSVLTRAETSVASASSVSKPGSLLEGAALAILRDVRWWPRRIYKQIRWWFSSKWDSIVYRFPQPEDEAAYVAYYRKKLVMRFRIMMVLNIISSVVSMLLIFAVYQFLEPLGDGGWLDNWVLTDGVDVGLCLLLSFLFKIIRPDVATRIVEVAATLYGAVAIVLAFANSMRREVFQPENRAATLIGNHHCLLTIFTLTAIRLRPRMHFSLLCLFIFMLIVQNVTFYKPSPYFTLELQGIVDMGTLFGSGSLCLLFEAAQRKYYLARNQYSIDAAKAAAVRMAEMSSSDDSGAIPYNLRAGVSDMKRLSASIAIL